MKIQGVDVSIRVGLDDETRDIVAGFLALAARTTHALEMTTASADNISHRIEQIGRHIGRIETRLELIVTDFSALTGATSAVAAVVGEVGQALATHLANVAAQIQSLRDQVAAGATDQATIDAATAQVTAALAPLVAIKDDLVASSNDPSNPVPPIDDPAPTEDPAPAPAEDPAPAPTDDQPAPPADQPAPPADDQPAPADSSTDTPGEPADGSGSANADPQARRR